MHVEPVSPHIAEMAAHTMIWKTLARRGPRGTSVFLASLVFAGFIAREVDAQPLRLRADAVAESRSPAGLVVLQGEDTIKPWLSAEGLVWTGARANPIGSPEGAQLDPTGDVLSLQIKVRHPKGWAEVRAGRWVLTTGALLPVQLDGGSAMARLPFGMNIEVFGGAPVVPRFKTVPFDWLVGGRVSQSVGGRVTAGLAYAQRRSHGDVASEELGADLAAAIGKALDLGGRATYDLVSLGLADARGTISVRTKTLRFEAFGSHRVPGRLLPATSLFSVLGDFPSEMVGGTIRWQAAPRLDLLGSGAGQFIGGRDLGYNAWIRAVLRTDDEGKGSLGLEVRRQDVSTAQWTGVRATGVQPFLGVLHVAAEVEIVLPDYPHGRDGARYRGDVWPWGLLALGWRPARGWEAAAGVEASASPERRFSVDALVRLSKTLEVR